MGSVFFFSALSAGVAGFVCLLIFYFFRYWKYPIYIRQQRVELRFVENEIPEYSELYEFKVRHKNILSWMRDLRINGEVSDFSCQFLPHEKLKFGQIQRGQYRIQFNESLAKGKMYKLELTAKFSPSLKSDNPTQFWIIPHPLPIKIFNFRILFSESRKPRSVVATINNGFGIAEVPGSLKYGDVTDYTLTRNNIEPGSELTIRLEWKN